MIFYFHPFCQNSKIYHHDIHQNLQIQKKIDLLAEKSNKIEELIKISEEKLDHINEKLLQNKKAEHSLKSTIYNNDLDYELCKLWAKEIYDKLKNRYK